MHIDLNLYRQSIEKWVAILLLLIFGWLTVGCVLEVYAEGGKNKVKASVPGIGEGFQK